MKKTIIFLLFLHLSALAQDAHIVYPFAKADTVKDNYFGTTVYDPYRWLENDALTATKVWIKKRVGIML